MRLCQTSTFLTFLLATTLLRSSLSSPLLPMTAPAVAAPGRRASRVPPPGHLKLAHFSPAELSGMDLYLGLLHRLASVAILLALALPLTAEAASKVLEAWSAAENQS